MRRISWIAAERVSFSRRTLLHGVWGTLFLFTCVTYIPLSNSSFLISFYCKILGNCDINNILSPSIYIALKYSDETPSVFSYIRIRILRCVIPVVCRINQTIRYTHISSNTTIYEVVWYLLYVKHNYMFRPQMLVIFRLYNENLSISYAWVCRGV
jgi:hypothetical protein